MSSGLQIPEETSSTRSLDERKLSYKMQKQKYHYEKRRVAQELLHTLKDPAVVVMADWLKIRGSLRKWMKHGYWIGTVLLTSCELIERPSKKNGFCFKLFHPLDQSIWATRGPKGEAFGAVTMPLPTSYLICRAPSEEAGRCWMDGLELALRCSNLLLRTMNKQPGGSASLDAMTPAAGAQSTDLEPELDFVGAVARDVGGTRKLSETEAERHFAEAGLGDENALSDSDNEGVFVTESAAIAPAVERTNYVQAPPEVFGALGEAEQTEEVADENKSLIWGLMKQLRPGMDLSRVVLPTFILEPRSFLEKLADFYYHVDLLGRAAKMDDPFQRMKTVVKFYLSGFYKKPKGLKKPYNPILGEVFRCNWYHKDTDSRTFYIAEQVSHHPPVSTFFVTNKKEGFNVSGTILAKSKFYGNSLSAIMAGSGKITLLTRGENYLVTLPYAHCKGLILGTLTMELGGQVKITCDRTSYSTELEFKLKPMFRGNDAMNAIVGKIRLGNETLADIDGHWDSEIYITDRKTGTRELFWKADAEIIKERLQRWDVPVETQEDFESQKLWMKVAEAIRNSDQVAATDEKTVLEEAQRKRAKELRDRKEAHVCRLFDFDQISGQYVYKHADYRPWDAQNDLEQYEGNFIILTESRHPAPLVRTMSLASQLTGASGIVQSAMDDANEWSEDEDMSPVDDTKSRSKHRTRVARSVTTNSVQEALKHMREDLDQVKGALFHLRENVESLADQTKKQNDNQWVYFLILVSVFVVFQAVIMMSKTSSNHVSS